MRICLIVGTPELRPDILDKQVTIELGKMEKDIFTTKSPEDTQHCKCVKYTGHLSHEAQQVLLSVFVLTHLPEIRDK
jgi:hypothetical protein